MVTHNNNEGLYIEQGVHPPHFDITLDDDGRPKRTGNFFFLFIWICSILIQVHASKNKTIQMVLPIQFSIQIVKFKSIFSRKTFKIFKFIWFYTND